MTRRSIILGCLAVATLTTGLGRSFSAMAADIPKEIRTYWRDPVKAFARERSKERPNYFLIRPMTVTAKHIEILRRSVLTWDPTEVGAPAFVSERPYGRRDFLAQISEVFATTTPRATARQSVELLFALGALLQHGDLAPGLYKPANLATADLLRQLIEPGGSPVPHGDLAINGDGAFSFTKEHRTLLRHLSFDWPRPDDIDALLDSDGYPAAQFDAKRPYGALSYYQVDMAMALKRVDILQKKPGDTRWFLAPQQDRAMTQLHRQMLPALQVFLEKATLAPGPYTWAKP
jgi:hypothetical protein